MAFGILYVSVGLPVTGIADRTRCGTVLAESLDFWSLMIALSGAATFFLHLMLAKIGVGA